MAGKTDPNPRPTRRTATRKSAPTPHETFTPLTESDPVEGFDPVEPEEELETAPDDGTGEETALATIEPEEQLATANEAASISTMYSLNVTPEDIKMPVIKLMQGISPMVMEGEARAGEWVIERKPSKTITVTVHGIARTQKRRIRDGDQTNVVCTAHAPLGQRLQGVGDPGLACANCEFSKWWEDDAGNRKPPLCTEGYEMLVETQGGKFALMQFERTALTAGKEVCTIVAQNGGRPTSVTFSSELTQRGSNRYYTPKAVAAS